MDEDDWSRLYLSAFDHVNRAVRKIKGIITAFNTNIDCLHFIKGQEAEKLVSRPEFAQETLDKLESLPFKIETPSDLLAGLISCMKSGRAAEWVIYNKETFEWISSNFSADKFQMGGQAGNTAYALAKLGVQNVYPHTSRLSEAQAKLFHDLGNIRIPVVEGKEINFRRPEQAVRTRDESLVHWILEFGKGATVRLAGEEIKAPSANRFIASWDEANARMEIDPAFEEGSLKIIKDVDKAMISGYQLLRTSYPNGSDFNKYIERTTSLISRWKKANSMLRIHYEQTFLKDHRILANVLGKVFPYVDLMGTNEDETANVLDAYGHQQLAQRIRSEHSASAILDGASVLLRTLNLSRILVHTKDFILSLLTPNYGISPLIEQYALLFGAASSAARAITGRYVKISDVQDAIGDSRLRLSEIGLAQHEALAKKMKRTGDAASKAFLETGIGESRGYTVVFAVTKITDAPICTVGLGDCVTAGILIGETQ